MIDGDTIELGNGQRVRLVQIDTPEVYGGYKCYGRGASVTAKRLLAPGTRVRLLLEPTSDPVDQYGRLLRYVVRASDGVNINVHLVRIGSATPWFYDGQRGRYAAKMDALAKKARAKRLGLWGCVPEDSVRPPQRGRDATVTDAANDPRCSNCGRAPHPDENADDEWRVESDGTGEVARFLLATR